MSTLYGKTDNYALNLYGDDDPADLRDGYNGSMHTIDTTLGTHLNRIEGLESRETHDEEVVKALLGDNTVDKATAQKTKWDTASRKSDEQEPKVLALETKVRTLEHRTVKNVVLLGDSWTESQNHALYRQLQVDTPGVTWYNYGNSGAQVQELPNQVNSARNDTALHVEEVTDVIIVMGTNNVFWTNLNNMADISQEGARQAFLSVRNYFTKARIMFFPNNSKTLNDGRNFLYQHINEGARMAGLEVHEESLTLLCGHTEWFYGDDQGGVQHLSENGYFLLADRIANVLHGGAMFAQGLMGRKSVSITDPSSSDNVGENSLQLYGIKNDNTGIERVGYGTSAHAYFTYYSDQTVDIEVGGRITLTASSLSNYHGFVWGCPNWYKRIAPNTLPYVFAGGVKKMSLTHYLIEGDITKIVMESVNSSKSADIDYDSFYIPVVKSIVETYSGKYVETVIQRAPTMVTGGLS